MCCAGSFLVSGNSTAPKVMETLAMFTSGDCSSCLIHSMSSDRPACSGIPHQPSAGVVDSLARCCPTFSADAALQVPTPIRCLGSPGHTRHQCSDMALLPPLVHDCAFRQARCRCA